MSAAFLTALLPLFFITACYEPIAGPSPAAAGLRVVSTTPVNAAAGIPVTSNVTATFNEPMDPASITSATFTLTGPGTTPISGAVTLNAAGTTAAFDPDGDLPPAVQCTATITTGARSLQGDPLPRNHVWRFTTAAAPDITAPTVVSTFPANGTPDAAINTNITATFSEAMNPATFNAATFTVTGPGATPISGTVSCSGNTATFNPAADLPSLTLCTATVLAGVTDLAGNPLAAAYTWQFTTAAAPDTTPPTVTITGPSLGAVNNSGSVSYIVTYSEAGSYNLTPAFIALNAAGGATGTVSVTNGTTASATVTITGATGDGTLGITVLSGAIVDLAGNPNPASAPSAAFLVDNTAPFVMSTTPLNGAVGVSVGTSITATFSEPVDPSTISNSSFIVTDDLLLFPISGSVNLTGGNTADFTPLPEMPPGTPMTATVTTEVKDIAGNSMASDYVWNFTTATTPTSTVSLGTAGNFSILAKTVINNVPPSIITGDIGISPASATDITGFSLVLDGLGEFATSPEVVSPGRVYASNYLPPTPTMLTTAIIDLETAYFDAAGRVPHFVDYFAGSLTGQTLAPGVYKWDSPVMISSSVTLQGGLTDVFIFQIVGGLDVYGDIILSGGALASNVFWQVAGGPVNIGSGWNFKGIVLSATSITLGGSAAVNGRLLTTTGVDLFANTVTPP